MISVTKQEVTGGPACMIEGYMAGTETIEEVHRMEDGCLMMLLSDGSRYEVSDGWELYEDDAKVPYLIGATVLINAATEGTDKYVLLDPLSSYGVSTD